VRGLAILALGILFLVRPVSTIMILLTFLRTRKYVIGWGWELFAGILGIISGAIICAFPWLSAMMSMMFAVTLVSVLALLNGITSIVKGIRLCKKISNEWSMILAGAIMVVFAVLAFLFPRVAIAVIVWTLGVCAIAGGIWNEVLSLRMRKSGKTLKE
jgi:uncharacterized membrane protein HdeD (DUF308 family)